MVLRPIGDRLIVKSIPVRERSKLIIAGREKEEYALVVGIPNMSIIQIGDKVVLPKYVGKKVKHGTENLLIVDEKDVLAVIQRELPNLGEGIFINAN